MANEALGGERSQVVHPRPIYASTPEQPWARMGTYAEEQRDAADEP
jgi:hypothetical protein